MQQRVQSTLRALNDKVKTFNRSSYQLDWAEEDMNQLGRTRVLYVFLQFGLQGVQ